MTTTESESRPTAATFALSDLSEKGVKERWHRTEDTEATEGVNQEFSLAPDWSELPRLSPTAGATASLIENWIDETENRAWFLYEILYRA